MSENSSYRAFLEVNSFTAPSGPLLASSKSCKSCNRRCLDDIQSHLNWPKADATTRSSELFDTAANVETIKLRGTLRGNVGSIWLSYLSSTKTRAPKAPRLKNIASSSPIHQSTNQRLQISAKSHFVEIDLRELRVAIVDIEFSSPRFSEGSILPSTRASELDCGSAVWISKSSRLLWRDMTL